MTKPIDKPAVTKAKPPPHKRLFFDIETSPNIGFFWQPGYKLNISHENIIRERAIICIAWKWAGKKRVYCSAWDENQCDKKLLQEFIAVMHEADEIVTQNGDQFDTPWIRTRALKHGILMSPEFVSLDTLKAARSKFNFNSNQLNYIARYLEIGQKKPTDFGLWKAITLDNDKKALKTMVNYCKHDVKLLEQVWDRMNSYLPAKFDRGATTRSCPECASNWVVIVKHKVTAAGYRRVQFQCRDCGKYHTVATSKWEK